MKQYRAPSYPKNKERRSNQDRRQNDTSNALQPLALAFMKYLEIASDNLEKKVDVEFKSAEAMSKFIDNLGNLKVQIIGLSEQSYRQRKRNKKSDNEHHRQVKKIILKMREKDATYQEITDYLEKNNIPTFRGRGKWHAQTVHRLYLGYLDE